MIFQPASRYPADPRAIFILALSVFSAGTALAIKAAPESLEAAVPTWAVIMWNILLLAGSATTLVGMMFQSVNGIIAEQVGSVTVGVTALFYATIAFAFVGTDSISTVGIIAAWGLSCLARWMQLQILINNAYKRQRKHDLLQAVYRDIEERALRDIERRAKNPGRR